MANRRVQNQHRIGREGFGWVALDIKSSPDVVFNTLKDFKRYHEIIPTVRSTKILAVQHNTTVVRYTSLYY